MMIDTTKGPMDETDLEKKEYTRQAPSGSKLVTEYWLGVELVHRSVAFTPNAESVSALSKEI